jgi:hypothetical protein
MILLRLFAREGQRQNERERERRRETLGESPLRLSSLENHTPACQPSRKQSWKISPSNVAINIPVNSISLAPNKVILCISSAPFQTAKFPLAK